MKYFTKYLPVEEEIKNGDSVKFNMQSTVIEHNIIVDNTSIYDKNGKLLFDKKGSIKVKLFLCSKNVKDGDTVYDTEANYTRKLINKHNKTDFDIKVIGEISPGAIWTKEDDMFNEEDWKLYGCHKDGFIIDELEKRCLGEKWIINLHCKMRCSQCNSFH